MADQKATVASRLRIASERCSGALTWTAIGSLAALVVFGGPSRQRAVGPVTAAVPTSETIGATTTLPVETLVGQEAQSQTTFSVAEAKLKVKRGARGSASKSSPAAAEPKTEPPAATPVPAVAAPSATPSPPQDAAPQTKTATPAATPSEPVEPPFWSDAEIAAARAECTGIMAGVEADWSVAPPMRLTACGAPGPISLRSIGAARADVAPAAITNCQTAAALARWMDTHVQPAAKERFGTTVSRIAIAGSYTCRNRYGQKAAPLSEHALANAVDISSFKLTDAAHHHGFGQLGSDGAQHCGSRGGGEGCVSGTSGKRQA